MKGLFFKCFLKHAFFMFVNCVSILLNFFIGAFEQQIACNK
jgi:hypothetical protein